MLCTMLQVHYQHSYKRVSENMNPSHSLAHQAFTTIGYVILRTKLKEDILSLFRVLGGEEPLTTARSIVLQNSVLKEYMYV